MNELDVARNAAEQAGEAIIGVQDKQFDVERKDDDSPVTKADHAASKIIHDWLDDTPHGIIDEETEPTVTDSDTTWIVDPLDGTKEFIRGGDEYTVNIALVRDGTPVLGVVHQPKTNDTYTAVEDQAWKNDAEITPSDTPLDEAVVAVSNSHPDDELNAFLDHTGVKGMRGIGSSLKGCKVAAGDVDAYPRFQELYSWDVAAMHAILQGAGCQMTTWDDTSIRHGNGRIPAFIAAHPSLHDAFLDAYKAWSPKHT